MEEAMTLSQPDHDMNLHISNRIAMDTDMSCDLCLKPHQRRDLLLRHRRRCQGPRKSTNRRRACDACAQAKAKCCYTQPICTRCTKRGTPCVYAVSSSTTTMDTPEQRGNVADVAQSNLESPSSRLGNFAASNQPFVLDLDPWYFSPTLDPTNMTVADLTRYPQVTLPDFATQQPAMMHKSPVFTPSSETISRSQASSIAASAQFTSSSSDRMSTGSSASSVATPPSPAPTSTALVRVLSEYASLLMKGSFVSPILHLSQYSLYRNVIPDMSYLPLTSMAICCGSGISFPNENRFFRRAMDAARERLIGNFPTYDCMQQWDALHAMMIYETLELRESMGDQSAGWKHTPRVKGLGSPFLLKMAESYLQTYPEIRNIDVNVFSDPGSVLCPVATTTWARWRTTETARRTIFLVNILNFYSNRDQSVGEQLPYYQPLNDELILHMLLPCSEAAWVARTEEDWGLAMDRNSPRNTTSTDAYATELCLKSIISKFTREDIQNEISSGFGFGDSNELRRLVILCASEQFS